MALHAAQGPKLGLPQMISSRVQFGVLGACIPIILVCMMYLGFTATGAFLSGKALSNLMGISTTAGILLFAFVVMVLAALGYKVIHMVGKIGSIVGIMAFIYMFVVLLERADLGSLLAVNHFSWASFMLAISLAASWQIAFGPYVADYSRYLPSQTDSKNVFSAVFAGSVIGAQIAMMFGVFIAQLAGKEFMGHEVEQVVGLTSVGTIAALLYLSIVIGKLTISVLNSYGSFMCLATIYSSFKGNASFTKTHRLITVVIVVAISAMIAILGQGEFLKTFKGFILFLLTFFIPWSAINLVDYYKISKGHYNIQALNDVNGQYGKWNWVGLGCYFAGVLIQLPFIDSPFFTGSIAKAMGGLDLSWLVGLIATAILYYMFASKKARNAVI